MMPTLFLAPERLWLLLGLLPLVAVAIWAVRRRRRALVRFTGMDLLDEVAPRRPTWQRWVVTALFLTGIGVSTASLAQPARTEEVSDTIRGRIVVLMDTSLSMEATDVDPSRLAAAKDEATDFVDEVDAGVEVGLVSFNGRVTRDVGLTTDHDQVTAAIDALDLGESTAVGEGLRAAIDELSTTDDAFPGAIVLLSDGETTVGIDPQVAADEAAEAGIPVFTIAFGTESGQILDPLSGQIVPVPVAEGELQAIAETTGATFTAAGSSEGLSAAYDQISGQLEELIGEPEIVEVEITWQWVAAALVLLVLAWLGSQWWLRGVM
ncbi:VWA domain-containing protein [Salsipaludibacter albus]|uniref:VWA domain-containing protein n=1 Tax=Salsipaludibacter albus TaxID=2849650 RepID=UPI001EE3A80E|nr:VWA domain-containing protein [Salsipaludibacter albus]MBY5161197.1 VWA domain-containing protein [Salsipaludibacter albus]